MIGLVLVCGFLLLTIFYSVRAFRTGYPGVYPALLAYILYIAACSAPAVGLDFGGDGVRDKPTPGYGLLFFGFLFGFLAAFLPGWWLAWMANVPLVIAGLALLSGRPSRAAGWGIAALVMSVGVWYPVPIGRPLVGYYLWVGSMAVVVAGAFWTRRRIARTVAEAATHTSTAPDDDLGW